MEAKARRKGTATDDRLYWLCRAVIAGLVIYVPLRYAGVV